MSRAINRSLVLSVLARAVRRARRWGAGIMLDGVKITKLKAHCDHRGVFTEIFRASWPTGVEPLQWNVVSSGPNVLRGFHVHVRHADYLLVLSGELVLGLKDIRAHSLTAGQAQMLILRPAAPVAVTMAPGVAHGFYFPKPSMHIYGVSHYWNMEDELGCRWDDPEIGLDWPAKDPLVSERDEKAGSFADMVEDYRRASAGYDGPAKRGFA